MQRYEWAKLYSEDLGKIRISIGTFNETIWDGVFERWLYTYDENDFRALYEEDRFDVVFTGASWTEKLI